MIAQITYGHSMCRIERGVLSTDAINDIVEECSYEVAGAEHMKRSGKFGRGAGGWDGLKRLYHKGHRTFPTGLLHRVVRVLEKHKYEIDLQNKNPAVSEIEMVSYERPGGEWAPRDYQMNAIDTAYSEERCMIQVATGGGKTVIAGHLIRRCKTRTIFLVHTKDLLYQAKDTFSAMFGAWNVGQIGDGIVEEGDITVMTIQTAARALDVKYEKESTSEDEDGWLDKDTDHRNPAILRVLQNCGLVFMDECHRVAAPTATAVVSAIGFAPYRYGLSASPWRDDGADLALEAVFGRVAVNISASELIDQGHLVAPIIRIRDTQPVKFAKKVKYAEIYKHFIVENEDRNNLIVSDAASKVKRGLTTLVLVRQISHGEVLRSKLSDALGIAGGIPFLSGKDDSSYRRSVIEDARQGRLKCFVATTIADEGLDIKPLSGLVLAGGGKSSTRALQRVGRVLRPFPGKTRAEITDFEDKARTLIDHSYARLNIYQSEPRFTITDV